MTDWQLEADHDDPPADLIDAEDARQRDEERRLAESDTFNVPQPWLDAICHAVGHVPVTVTICRTCRTALSTEEDA